RGEPVRHPGEVRGRRPPRGGAGVRRERARPGGRRDVTAEAAAPPRDEDAGRGEHGSSLRAQASGRRRACARVRGAPGTRARNGQESTPPSPGRVAVTRPGGSQPEPPAAVRRAVAGGCAAGLASGWNISNTGAVAQQLAASYGVGLATVGLFATALFVTHLLLQMPAGRASDRLGERRVSLAGIALIVCFNAVALATPDTALALAARALTGVGTGISFVSGSAYVRVQGGSPFAQGLFGGVALAGGGLALAIVPPVESAIGWRAPYATAVLVGLAGALVLAAGPGDTARTGAARAAHAPVGVFRDARLYRLAVLYAASLGLSIVIGNWVVTLLHRHGGL